MNPRHYSIVKEKRGPKKRRIEDTSESKRWTVVVQFQGVKKHLGSFTTKEEAEFELVNFILKN